jgi:hypothetical protein
MQPIHPRSWPAGPETRSGPAAKEKPKVKPDWLGRPRHSARHRPCGIGGCRRRQLANALRGMPGSAPMLVETDRGLCPISLVRHGWIGDTDRPEPSLI